MDVSGLSRDEPGGSLTFFAGRSDSFSGFFRCASGSGTAGTSSSVGFRGAVLLGRVASAVSGSVVRIGGRGFPPFSLPFFLICYFL